MYNCNARYKQKRNQIEIIFKEIVDIFPNVLKKTSHTFRSSVNPNYVI
jgi:hypothetical protein